MSADTELLRRYVEESSEAAFAELVRLHLNLVYFAALRLLGGDAHRAQDVAQTVFTDLARKASTLTHRPTLTGWLHTSTRFAAAKVRRAEFSRQQRHLEAETMHTLLDDDSNSAADWERLRPMIDDLVHELSERDREAVLLRFFENRPFAEIGASLKISEDAARMRVERALDKLRRALARQGVGSSTSALALAFANQAGAAPPAGLLAAVTSAALTGMPAGSTSIATAGLLGGTKMYLALAAAALVAGAGVIAWRQTSTRPLHKPSTTVHEPDLRHVTPARRAGSEVPSTAASAAFERKEWRAAAELKRAGRDSPRDTLETLMLAIVENDVDAFTTAVRLGPVTQEKVAAQLARLPEEARAKYGPVERLYALEAIERAGRNISLISAVRVLEQKSVDHDHAGLLVQMQLVGGPVHEHTFEFERSVDGWRLELPEK